MDELQNVFDYQGCKVRTVMIEGEAWFVAKDVCEVLGLEAKLTARRLEESMKSLVPRTHLGLNPGRSMLIFSEAGVYKAVMRSDKPEAITFQNWIASEVLPSIRKNGMYLTPEVAQEATEDTKTFLARALIVAMETLDEQKKLLEEARPKVELYDSFMDASQTQSLTDVAKVLEIEGIVLNAHLQAAHILMRNKKGELFPTKAYEDKGYFKVKIMPKYIHTRVTHMGFLWISKLAKERGWIY